MNWVSSYTEYVGMMAAFFTTVAFLPQVIRSWQFRGRQSGELSGAMLLLFGAGVGMWSSTDTCGFSSP